MLYFAKNFPATQRHVRDGSFYHPMNDELHGRTLGLIGLGASGRDLAVRAHAFGMHLIGVDVQRPADDVLEALGVSYLGGPEAIYDLLPRSDYVSLHVPLTRHTRHMLDARALGLMRHGSILINVARGDLVDEAALVDALRDGRLGGAGLDVFAQEPLDPASPLLQFDNVVLTPHVAGVTTGTSRRRAGAVAENVRRTEAGLPPLYTITGVD
jgi:phosphoglycerate dehydrogenase-like enzyme